MTPSTRHAYTYPPRRLRVSRWIGRNLARLSYAVRVEPTWLEVNRWALGIDGLGPELDGFHIVQLSDLHFGKHLPRDYVAEAVGSALAEKPDLVVLTGDFVHKGFRHVEQAAESLAGLRARTAFMRSWATMTTRSTMDWASAGTAIWRAKLPTH